MSLELPLDPEPQVGKGLEAPGLPKQILNAYSVREGSAECTEPRGSQTLVQGKTAVLDSLAYMYIYHNLLTLRLFILGMPTART